MKSIGIREAKAKFSSLLRGVRRGEEWIITERGNPVAKIVPFEKKQETVDEWVARLEREGRLIPPPPGAKMPTPLDIEPTDALQELLRQDRESGW